MIFNSKSWVKYFFVVFGSIGGIIYPWNIMEEQKILLVGSLINVYGTRLFLTIGLVATGILLFHKDNSSLKFVKYLLLLIALYGIVAIISRWEQANTANIIICALHTMIHILVGTLFIVRDRREYIRNRFPQEEFTILPARHEALVNMIKFIYQELHQLPKDEPHFFEDEELYIIMDEDPYNKENLQALAEKILNHLGLLKKGFVIELKNNNSASAIYEGTHQAGSYQNYFGLGIITIRVEEQRSFDEVFAILCHECMHLFLHEKGLYLDNTKDNELLTDVALVYFGLSFYAFLGYYERSRIIQNEDQRIEYKKRLGYITIEEIRYVAKELIGYRKMFEHDKKVRREAEQIRMADITRTAGDLNEIEWLFERIGENIKNIQTMLGYFYQLLDGMETINSSVSEADMLRLQECYFARESKQDEQIIEQMQSQLGQLAITPALDAARILDANVTSYVNRIAQRNVFLGEFHVNLI